MFNIKNFIMKLKEKLTDLVKKVLSLDEELSMENGAALVCKDKEGIVNKSVKIVATHINPDADEQIDMPQFDVISQVSKDGQYSMHVKHMLTLAADDCLTEGSKKLITSGQLYEIVKELQNQIDVINQKINK